jgi:hypothetical protein
MLSYKDGFDTYIRNSGVNISAEYGANYVSKIEEEIDKYVKAINNQSRKIGSSTLDSAKGFYAELSHAGTFNIKAAVEGVKARAVAVDDNGLVDIVTSAGDKYQSKYYKDAAASAAQQAKSNLQRYEEYCAQYRLRHDGQNPAITLEEYIKNNNPHDPYYLGQSRIIPADQLKDAQEWLKQRIEKESNGGRPEQVKRYQETLDKLTDRIKSNDGAESIPLTEEEAKELVRLAKEGNFDPAKWGLTTEELIKFNHIMEQASKAGLSAALVNVVLKVAPEISEIICELIKNGEVNPEDFKRIGFIAIKGGAEGFVRGTIAASVMISCNAGLLGESFKDANPDIIGVMVAITLNTMQNACLMAFGKMSKHEFAEHCAQDLIVTICSVGTGIAGRAVATVLFSPAAAMFGYMVGSFIGSVVGAFVYKGMYSCVIAFCVESGSTFLGLVEQDYTLPKGVLESIGIKVFEYDKFEFKKFEHEKFKLKKFEQQKFEPIRININFLRRGVMKVGVIGYV